MADQFEELETIHEAAVASTSSTSVVNATKVGKLKKRLSSWVEGVDDQPEGSAKEGDKQREEAVSSPLSPQSIQKSETDSFSERRSSAEEQVKSPTSSITDSKRLSTSSTQDALSSTLRTKIREETKSKINQKRESIHLTKRLQRNKSQVIDDEPLSDIDQDSLDAQIEHSLQLGSKFVKDKEDNRLPSGSVQYDFLTATYKDENVDEESDASVFYGRARPQCRNNLEKFQALCTSYDKRNAQAITDAENGLYRAALNSLLTESAHDYSVLMQRLGAGFIDSTGKLLGSGTYLTGNPLRPEQDDYERSLCSYVKAEDWKTASKSLEHKEFVQLDIDINRVVFDHHWLFSKEDMICSVIRNLHSSQTLRAKESLLLLKSLIKENQRAQRADPSDTELQTRIEANISDMVSDLEEKQNNYIRLGQLIEENWHRLRLMRLEQGFSSTTLTVQKTFSTAQEMADVNLSNLSERLQEFTRIPVYTLLETNPLTEERPKEELQRLALIHKCHIQMSIHFNDILVCKTKFRALDANFSALFGQIYNLQIHEIPQSVTVTFIEKAPRMDSRILAKVGLPLPDEDKITSVDAPLESIEFASDLVIDRMFSAVGSGAQASCIAGKLFCNVSWAQRGIRTSKAANIHGLFKLNQKHQRDVHFELIPKAVRLCTDEEFESDLRLEVLKQRSERKHAKNKNTERVPLMSSEIDPQIISKNLEKLDDQFDFSSGIEAHRIIGNQYAVKIRMQLLDRFASEERIKNVSEIVREEPMPTIFSAFGALFAPMDTSRKLKPMRRVDTGQQFIPGIRYRIVVNIQSALNLPERLNGGLHPLVEASFQGSKAQTSVASGKNPNWQQTIEIKLKRMRELEKDFKAIVDLLELNIYDQIVSKLRSDDREPNSLHEQLEKHLIGSIRIPFSTLLCNSKIDGHLRIQKPLFLSSYKCSDRPSYMKVLVAINPQIVLPQCVPSSSMNDSNESEQLINQCVRWRNEAKAQYPERRFHSLALDACGRRVLASRYIRAIKPPPQVESQSLERTVEVACRIVSYIPFLSDPIMFPGVCDLWTSAQQFLSIGCGDEEEHAILLCCWLLYFNISAYVLLGSALPEGSNAAYVLAFVNEKAMLLNPTDGNCYSSDDALCPMLSVGTAISSQNIYANIQSHQHPSQLSFDFKKSKCWKGLFDKDRDNLESIQPESIRYSEIDDDTITQLRSNLERKLKLRFDETRPYGIPQWNLLASRILRELLVEFDSFATSSSSANSNSPNVDIRLAQLKTSYKVNAIAFRERYTSFDQLFECLMTTNMHINSEKNVQFALAVHIQPFMNNIVSCSLAIAALVPLINT